MSSTRLQLTLIGALLLILIGGLAVYVFFAWLTYIFIGCAVLALFAGGIVFVCQQQIARLPLKAHELEELRLTHAQEMERERLSLERERQALELQHAQEKHTLELQLITGRWQLEQHLSMTRVLPDTNGHYPYIVTQVEDGQVYQHLPNPHITTKQIAAPAQSKATLEQTGASTELSIPARYDLRTIWQDFTPSREQVFLGKTAQGNIIVPLHQLWHIALTGPTGGGKTSILRMLLMQLAYLNCHITLCDIHYAPIKEDGRGLPIDWRPLEKRLAQPPIRDIKTIAEWMEWLAFGELQTRIDRQYRGEKVGRPLFFTIEELPAVLDEAGTQVAQPLAKVLRQGRQYGICFVGASQDLLTNTLKMSQGPRECFRTGYYTGGDPHTAKALLDLRNGEKINEDGIGIDGLVYLKTAMHQAMQTRVGWASNEALYDLLDVPASDRLGRSGTRIVDAQTDEHEAFSRRPANVQTFPQRPVVTPVERSDAASDERLESSRQKMLSDVEIQQFIAAYRVGGSIDKALSAIGRGASYRDHARELVRVHNLRKEA